MCSVNIAPIILLYFPAGSCKTEPVKMLKQNILGRLVSWNNRKREGWIKEEPRRDGGTPEAGRDGGRDEEIYVYYTSLHFPLQSVNLKKLLVR